jgi:hypothetical protein
MRRLHTIHRFGLVAALALALALCPGCATSGTVLNKATFGLVGDKQPDADRAVEKEARQAQEQQRKAEKRERNAAKKAAKQERKATNKAEKEASKAEGGGGLASKMTFGLVGGKSADEKAAKEAQQAEKQQRNAAKKAAKQQRKAAKKAEKEASKAEGGGGLASKMTFGLVGGKSADEKAAKEAQQAEKQQRNAAKKAAKQERKAAKKAEKEASKAEGGGGLASKMTFGLMGGKSADEKAAKEAQQAEKQQRKQAKRAEKQERKQAKKAEKEAEKAEGGHGLASKMTFGLIGGKTHEEKAAEEAKKAEKKEQKAAKRAELSPKERDKAEKKEAKQRAREEEREAKGLVAAVPKDLQKLAKSPFNTRVTTEESLTGAVFGVADRESYTVGDYGVCDLGDVRIAVKGMTFEGTWRTGRVVVDSTADEVFEGKSGKGNRRFSYSYKAGETSCTFGSVEFTIAHGVITIQGTEVPVGQGKRLVAVSGGQVLGPYVLE